MSYGIQDAWLQRSGVGVTLEIDAHVFGAWPKLSLGEITVSGTRIGVALEVEEEPEMRAYAAGGGREPYFPPEIPDVHKRPVPRMQRLSADLGWLGDDDYEIVVSAGLREVFRQSARLR